MLRINEQAIFIDTNRVSARGFRNKGGGRNLALEVPVKPGKDSNPIQNELNDEQDTIKFLEVSCVLVVIGFKALVPHDGTLNFRPATPQPDIRDSAGFMIGILAM